MKSHKQAGFTVVELLVAVVLLIGAGVLFMQQKSQIERVDRDRERKTAINAMYYSLEEVYYAANQSYPAKINKDNLKSLDPGLFKDPSGVTLGETGSDYHYDPLNCDGTVCRGYTLRTTLENEADYVKKSAH
ncbi:MAG: prepilin-type N-terminal cleavage/methylation domain-containing protein [Candidatus Saccharimonadales bacterium]